MTAEISAILKMDLPEGDCFKITNGEETHFGYKYVDGLNTLTEDFNDDPDVKCGKGGFYFTTKGHIQRFYSFGIYLREVTIPIDDPDFKIIKCKDGTKWRSNKIILGTRYSLFDPETYVKFGLDIWKNKYIVIYACQYGRIDFLDKLVEMNEDKDPDYPVRWDTRYDRNVIDKMILFASQHRQIAVLDWLEAKKIIHQEQIMKDSCDIECEDDINRYDVAILQACRKGYLDVLQWWDKNNFMDKINANYLTYALENKHYHVADWLLARCKNVSYHFDYQFISATIKTGDIAILQYCVDNKLVKSFDLECYGAICKADNFKEILEFLNKNNLINRDMLLQSLEHCANVEIFELVKSMGIELNIGKIMDNASFFCYGYVNILEWAKNTGLELTYSTQALYNASVHGRINVLDWWKNSGLELKYETTILTKTRLSNNVFNWWIKLLQVDGKIDIKYLITNESDDEIDLDDGYDTEEELAVSNFINNRHSSKN